MQRLGGISDREESLEGRSITWFSPLVVEVCVIRARPWGIEKDLEEKVARKPFPYMHRLI